MEKESLEDKVKTLSKDEFLDFLIALDQKLVLFRGTPKMALAVELKQRLTKIYQEKFGQKN